VGGEAGDADTGEEAAPDSEASDNGTTTAAPVPGRSDDWRVDSDTIPAYSVFEELDPMVSGAGLEAFRAQFEAEQTAPTVVAAIELCRFYLTASETPDDRGALAPFLSSVIVQSAVEGEWQQAGAALTLIDECGRPDWSLDALGQELCSPRVLTALVPGFQSIDGRRIEEFVAFAQRLGDWAIDLMGPVLVSIEGSPHELRIIEAIADDCRGCPERLAPWLSDTHPSAVRTTVRILGQIGGDAIAGLLRTVAEHPQQAVRDEVVAALKTVSNRQALAILVGLLDQADTRTFCMIVQRLGQGRNTEAAEVMLGYVSHPEFAQQPVEEKRAVYAALGSAGTDDILPRLEAELHNQNWLGGGQDAHRQAVARCIAQIATPAARRVLEHGARSRRAGLRETCTEMLGKFGKA
jgi:hypothetical protein